MIGPLQSALKLVGMSAVQLAAKLPQFVDGPPVFTGAVATEQMHQLVCASIAFTTKLIAVASTSDPSWATAAEMEAKLVAHLEGGGPAISADFQEAIEALVLASTEYAAKMVALVELHETTGADPFAPSANTRAQTCRLARAAVALTLQLTVLCSGEQPTAREGAQAMEEVLLAHLEEAFTLPEVLS